MNLTPEEITTINKVIEAGKKRADYFEPSAEVILASTAKEQMQKLAATKNAEIEKARKEERNIIKLRIEYDRRKNIPAEETVHDIYDSIELKLTPPTTK